MMHFFGQIRFEKAGTEESVSIFDTAILDEWRIPFGYWFDQMVDWMDLNAGWVLDTIKWPFDFLLDNFVNSFLLTVSWFWVVLFTVVFGALSVPLELESNQVSLLHFVDYSVRPIG